MIPLFIRGIIIYVIVILSVRLMGKRQIGQLQPSELVITILLSDVASMPLQNSETPLIGCLIAIFLLVSFEVISSVITMKFPSFRRLIEGNSVPIIQNGRIIEKNMREIRYTTDDLMQALRLKDVFDLSDVDCAFVETNGSVSVKLKKSACNVTVDDLELEPKDDPISCLVVSDGRIVTHEFELCNLTEEKLMNILKEMELEVSDILIMTYSKNGDTVIAMKEKKQ